MGALVESLSSLARAAGLSSGGEYDDLPASDLSDAHSGEERAAAARRDFFVQRRYLAFSQRLILLIGGEYLSLLSDAQRHASFAVFFPPSFPEGALPALLALGAGISNSSDAFIVKYLAGLAQEWIEGGGVRVLLLSRAAQHSVCPQTIFPEPPPWRQPRGKWMVSLVNSHTNATRIGWYMWEIDLRFAPGLPLECREWFPES